MDSDFVGKKFGDWTVLRFSHTDQYRDRYWVCHCTCGETGTVRQGNLTRGRSTRCRRCRNRRTGPPAQWAWGTPEN